MWPLPLQMPQGEFWLPGTRGAMLPCAVLVDEGERRFRCRNAHDVGAKDRCMAEETKTERIPRRPAPEFTEVGSFGEAIKTHGLIGTAVNDKNQYGPVGMMVLLFIVAAITSLGLLLIRSS